jgi:hypothetical protein
MLTPKSDGPVLPGSPAQKLDGPVSAANRLQQNRAKQAHRTPEF